MPRSVGLQRLLYQGRKGHPLDRLKELEQDAEINSISDVVVQELSELSENLGRVTAGEFIAPSSVATSVEPTNSGFTGSFMSGTPVPFGDDSYNVGTVAGGVFAAGFNTSGKFKAAFGEYTVDESGTLSEGLTFLHQFDATYNGIRRQGYIGMFVPAGGDRPSLRIYYNEPAASNLVANGSFESGDETSWTDTNTTWAVAADATYGYCDRHDGTATGCPPTLTQAVSVSASTVYQFSFASKMSSGYIPCAVSLIWKDGGSSVVRTDTIIGGTSSAWSVKGSVYTSPSTAATVTISVHAGEIFSDVSVTAFSLYALTSYSSIDFYDGKILADAYSGKPANLLGLPQTDMQFAQQMVYSATTATTGDTSQRFGFYVGPSAANANDGDTVDMQFVVAAGTYTFTVTGVTMNACGKTDGYVDGSTSTSWTGDDWYSAVLTNNVSASHSVTFTTGGRHTIRLKVNGKNGSSADYRVLLTNARLVPTSYSVEA